MDQTPENIAQTVAKILEQNGSTDVLNLTDEAPDVRINMPTLLSVPAGQTIKDVTKEIRDALEFMQPLRRRGTARLTTIDSLIGWANRFKGDNSVLYADNGSQPSLTCIADYHLVGPASVERRGDPTARHGLHRATYAFPLSKQWQAWAKISGEPLGAVDMGVFLENNILDVIDPPLSLTLPGAAGAEATEAELRLIDIARRLDGKYGTAQQLMDMAKSFTVNETADYSVSHNSTTGEAYFSVKSEHVDNTGQPIRPPKLFLIAIPVFENGPAYRLPVRFQYRKAGPSVKFILTLHDPKHARDHAFDEATAHAADATALPLLMGTPEN